MKTRYVVLAASDSSRSNHSLMRSANDSHQALSSGTLYIFAGPEPGGMSSTLVSPHQSKPLADLAAKPMTVERIFTRPPSSKTQLEHARVTVVAGAGIEGDRYFDHHDEPGQNITLIEAEEIESFLSAYARPYDLSISGRNLVTRGVRLNALVGKEFFIGSVRCRGVELCEPCLGFGTSLQSAELPAAETVRVWVRRAGLRADALSSGEIALGASVRESDAQPA